MTKSLAVIAVGTVLAFGFYFATDKSEPVNEGVFLPVQVSENVPQTESVEYFQNSDKYGKLQNQLIAE